MIRNFLFSYYCSFLDFGFSSSLCSSPGKRSFILSLTECIMFLFRAKSLVVLLLIMNKDNHRFSFSFFPPLSSRFPLSIYLSICHLTIYLSVYQHGIRIFSTSCNDLHRSPSTLAFRTGRGGPFPADGLERKRGIKTPNMTEKAASVRSSHASRLHFEFPVGGASAF